VKCFCAQAMICAASPDSETEHRRVLAVLRFLEVR
jgi:hypothetical protein